ncbi:MAG TPA: FAD-dependent oxidoreductase [Pyrinomonadaceae bacterium]|nr:FAD-dependent oxidoreductase [Pyrinomonadaceae bacterium]
MDTEVVVVGGGIGGLTVAALLAARGVDVCLLERESSVGGCAAPLEKFGYSFEQGYGLYACWETDEIHQRVFAELPVEPPAVRPLEPSYVVRLPDNSEIPITGEAASFENNLRGVFPECAEQAISFYRNLSSLSSSYRRLLTRTPEFIEAARTRKMFPFRRGAAETAQILQASKQTALQHLSDTSLRFRRFVDVQLQALGQGTSAQVSYLYAALALSATRGGMFALQGGASALVSRLSESIKQSGGRIRLNTPVLRLAYSSSGNAVGVDLLTGETIHASKAIVSNLTLWDTYGKLVGLNRTPAEMRQQLKSLRGWGAYLLYLGWDEAAASTLASDRILTLSDWQNDPAYDPVNGQLFFSAAPAWDTRAPEGKRAVTVHTFTDVDDWFTFHTDETDLEEKDQSMLETSWGRLHSAIPELGSSIEVIETATPRYFYEQTRRKLGMVGGLPAVAGCLEAPRPAYTTFLPNLYIVSDTLAPGGIAGLTYSATALANAITT